MAKQKQKGREAARVQLPPDEVKFRDQFTIKMTVEDWDRITDLWMTWNSRRTKPLTITETIRACVQFTYDSLMPTDIEKAAGVTTADCVEQMAGSLRSAAELAERGLVEQAAPPADEAPPAEATARKRGAYRRRVRKATKGGAA